MITKQRTLYLLLLFLLTLFPLSGCSSGSSPGKQTADETKSDTKTTSRETYTDVCTPQASQTVVYGDKTTSLDASHTENGYLMLCYNGKVSKVKLQITTPDGTVYTYTLNPDSYGSYETFPLSGSNGTYQADLYENVTDDKYALIFSQSLNVTLKDEFQPYLYPNQYVNFSQDSKAVSLAAQLTSGLTSDVEALTAIYEYVTANITYDNEKAATVSGNYLPDIDETLSTKKGICFDYASLTAAMLRSIGIPAKLAIGYSASVRHAWIDVYIQSVGWVERAVEFNGDEWKLMDPTFAATGTDESIQEYIGDGDNYITEYIR